MLFKTFDARIVKAAGDAGAEDVPDGTFEAIVSAFDVKDEIGDVVYPGAFKDDIAAWAASGDMPPVYWSHRMDDPDYNIGQVQDWKEVKADELGYPHPAGLWVKAAIDLETEGTTSKAQQVYRLMKGRRVTQFSFAYDIIEGAPAKSEAHDEHFALTKLHTYEVGPTQIGMNQDTELLGVKSMATRLLVDVKKGRVLSSKNETALREARDAIDAVLASLDKEDDDKSRQTPKAHPTQPAKIEEPAQAKIEEPTASGPAKGNNALARLRIARSLAPQ